MAIATAPQTRLDTDLSTDQLREMYALMWRIRHFEETVLDLFNKGHIRGTAHLYIGMEAVAAGTRATMGPNDFLASTHRGHGHSLAMGLDPKLMMAELLGRGDGYCKGKGGSMHVACLALGMLGADAVVGANAPITTGAALAARLKGEDRVGISFFGDGAASQGVVLEALNIAAVAKLPVVFICENNQWALSTSIQATLSVPDVATRAQGFGLPSVIVDGQDALAMHAAAQEAVTRARTGGGPTLIEAKTYRFHTHSAFATKDPRAADEVAFWKSRDPIEILGVKLLDAGVLTAAEAEALRAHEAALAQEAADFAVASPYPAPEEAFTDVFLPAETESYSEPGHPAPDSGVRQLNMVKALNEALHEEMERDPTVFVMGEDIGNIGGLFGVTGGLLERFGEERIREMPIAEPGYTGVGVGAAIAGAHPVVEIQVMDFLSLTMDQLANHAAKLRYMTGGQASVPMVLRGVVMTGIGLAAQHSQSLEAWVAHIPGLKVIMPSTPYDAKGLLKSAIRDGNPVVCFEKRLLYAAAGPVPEEEYLVPFGQAAVRRSGDDLTIVASGLSAQMAIEAADTLAGEGIAAEVIDLRTLVPLDMDTIIESVAKTHRVIVANDGYRNCGFAAEVMARIMEQGFDYLDAPVMRVTSEDVPIPCSEALEQVALISTEKIATAARELLEA